MAWKWRWGWDRHRTNSQPTPHKETWKEEEGQGCGCRWGVGAGERPRQDSAALDCQLVERWRRVSLSLLILCHPLLNWGHSSTACCGPEGEGAKPVAWGTRGGWPPPPPRQWAFAHTHPHGGCHGDQWSQMWLMEQGVVWVSGGSGIMPGGWAESRAPVPTPARPWTHPGLDLLT